MCQYPKLARAVRTLVLPEREVTAWETVQRDPVALQFHTQVSTLEKLLLMYQKVPTGMVGATLLLLTKITGNPSKHADKLTAVCTHNSTVVKTNGL